VPERVVRTAKLQRAAGNSLKKDMSGRSSASQSTLSRMLVVVLGAFARCALVRIAAEQCLDDSHRADWPLLLRRGASSSWAGTGSATALQLMSR
jgi:hypothetical protein